MKIQYIVICFLVIFLISGCAQQEIQPVPEKPAPIAPVAEQPAEQPEAAEALQTILEVNLTKEKLMSPNRLNITKGDVVRFYNRDGKEFYHNVVIYPAGIKIPKTSDVIVQSGNIKYEDYWEYTFNNRGEYAVKDIYSGTMRGEITADTVMAFLAEALEKGEVIGIISVE